MQHLYVMYTVVRKSKFSEQKLVLIFYKVVQQFGVRWDL